MMDKISHVWDKESMLSLKEGMYIGNQGMDESCHCTWVKLAMDAMLPYQHFKPWFLCA
jgi:hypothetical protein